MRQLCFHYHMHLDFSDPVHDHRFTLKCVPLSDSRQQVADLVVQVQPCHFVRQGTDGFGNVTIYGHMAKPHTNFYSDVQGTVTVDEKAPPALEPSVCALRYACQSSMTKLGDSLQAVQLPAVETNLERAKELMTYVHHAIAYTKGVTHVSTSAEEALGGGQGVCQDYAHVLLALCRRAQIPARYVAGFLVGEGYSHGWVEVFQPVDDQFGYWMGLDPTNHQEVTDQHIKVAVGRDAKDCMLNRGLFRGNSIQTQWASVIVYPKTLTGADAALSINPEREHP